jgi:hypothetical protein
MSLISTRHAHDRRNKRRQCDRCGKLAKDFETGKYARPRQEDGTIKSRDATDLDFELCEECLKIVQTEDVPQTRRTA